MKGESTEPNRRTQREKDNSSEGESIHGCELDLSGQIVRALYGGDFTIASKVGEPTSDCPKGRPEILKNPTKEKLGQLVLNLVANLSKQSKKQRSDARTATICRNFKKLPDIFLKAIGSKCQYKSREIDAVLRSYLLSFVKGFLVFYDLEEGIDRVQLFLEYIVLSFPEKKVKCILNNLQKHGFRSSACDFDSLKKQVGIRKKASKMNFTQLIDANNCFKLICSTMTEKLSELGESLSEDDARILEGLFE